MSNAFRNKLGHKPEVLSNIDKHEKLPTDDLHVGQHVMYQDSASKQLHPAIITSLCQEKQSYKIKITEGVVYWKTQVNLKPYTPQNKMAHPGHNQPVAQPITQPDQNQALPAHNPPQVTTSRPKRDTKVPVNLDL